MAFGFENTSIFSMFYYRQENSNAQKKPLETCLRLLPIGLPQTCPQFSCFIPVVSLTNIFSILLAALFRVLENLPLGNIKCCKRGNNLF
jgi:hypothetical protein